MARQPAGLLMPKPQACCLSPSVKHSPSLLSPSWP